MKNNFNNKFAAAFLAASLVISGAGSVFAAPADNHKQQEEAAKKAQEERAAAAKAAADRQEQQAKASAQREAAAKAAAERQQQQAQASAQREAAAKAAADRQEQQAKASAQREAAAKANADRQEQQAKASAQREAAAKAAADRQEQQAKASAQREAAAKANADRQEQQAKASAQREAAAKAAAEKQNVKPPVAAKPPTQVKPEPVKPPVSAPKPPVATHPTNPGTTAPKPPVTNPKPPVATHPTNPGTTAPKPPVTNPKPPVATHPTNPGTTAPKPPVTNPKPPVATHPTNPGTTAPKPPVTNPKPPVATHPTNPGTTAPKPPVTNPKPPVATHPTNPGTTAPKPPVTNPKPPVATHPTNPGTTGPKPPVTNPKPPVATHPTNPGTTGPKPPVTGPKPPVAVKPTAPVNPIKPVVHAPTQVRPPAEKQVAKEQAKQELKDPKKALAQQQAAAIQNQKKVAEVRKANEVKLVAKEKKDLEVVKKVSQATPAQQQAARVETAAKKAELDKKIAALQAKKTVVPPPARVVALPPQRPGAKFGINPAAHLANVQQPKKVVPVLNLNGRPAPSYLKNKYVADNIRNGEGRREQYRVNLQRNTTVVKNITIIQNTYVKNYNTVVINRGRDFNRYYHDSRVSYRNYYSPWYRRGFHGGYYYPVVAVEPAVLVHRHFWSPTVFWLYANSYEPEYYSGCYGEYAYYRAPVVPFRYVGVYYPTTVLIDFATEMAAQSYERQWAYRTALTNLTEELAQSISNQLLSSFTLNQNDVIVNHYERVNSHIYEMEGFVDHSWLHVPFKATIDIDDPSNPNTNYVFVPVTQRPEEADPIQVARLDGINTLMDSNNAGSADVAYEEPAPEPVESQNFSCSTFSADANQPGSGNVIDSGTLVSEDASVANTNAVTACNGKGGTFEAECQANIFCDDGANYAPKTTCTATSNGSNSVDVSRDADLAYSQAVKFCTAADGSDADECSQSAAVACLDESKNPLPQYQCTTSSNSQIYAGDLSFDKAKATQNAKDACNGAEGTSPESCNKDERIDCTVTNGVADPTAVESLN